MDTQGVHRKTVQQVCPEELVLPITDSQNRTKIRAQGLGLLLLLPQGPQSRKLILVGMTGKTGKIIAGVTLGTMRPRRGKMIAGVILGTMRPRRGTMSPKRRSRGLDGDHHKSDKLPTINRSRGKTV